VKVQRKTSFIKHCHKHSSRCQICIAPAALRDFKPTTKGEPLIRKKTENHAKQLRLLATRENIVMRNMSHLSLSGNSKRSHAMSQWRWSVSILQLCAQQRVIMRSVWLVLHIANIPLADGSSHRSTLSSRIQAVNKLKIVKPLGTLALGA
jgi:hypothetical protein